jgi:hypothetical protein
MAISLKHGFGSGKLDGTDATLVQPSNWNSDHVLAIGSPKLFGRTSTNGSTTPSSLSGITQANPGVFTTSGAHGLTVGQLVTISGAGGMTQVNGNTYVVNTTPLSTTFTVIFQGSVLSTATYTAYTSGGTVTGAATGVAEELSVAGSLSLASGTLTGTGATTGKAIAVAIVFS